MPRRAAQALLAWLAEHVPDLEDASGALAAGQVTVDRVVRTSPAFPVRPGAAVVVSRGATLRGEAKLRPAIEHFGVPVAGRVALDVGAAAGGFTKVLLERGAARVYAVDAGHGQLLGSLRQDERVVNLEATNLGLLTPALVPDQIEVFSVDVSYLALAAAVQQLNAVRIAPDADLVGLVKPMFELRMAAPPETPDALRQALDLARAGIESAGWSVAGTMDSPVRGARGAREMLVHARRRPVVAV